jgi:hypothetical protein
LEDDTSRSRGASIIGVVSGTDSASVFATTRNKVARNWTVLTVVVFLACVFAPPEIWGGTGQDVGGHVVSVQFIAVTLLSAVHYYAWRTRAAVVGRDPEQGNDVLAGRTVFGRRNVDLDALASVRYSEIWTRTYTPPCYLDLRDTRGNRLVVPVSDRDILRIVRRTASRNRTRMELSHNAAVELGMDPRRSAAGPTCHDARPTLVLVSVMVLGAVVIVVFDAFVAVT